MTRLQAFLTQSENVAGFFAPLFVRPEPALVRIPVRVEPCDVPQRLASRRRKSRVEVQIYGV